ncbi:endonuclease/exonuclease/phosphatase family protein [Sphingomonas xanthus]|uniref:Endonuclease n=1 Tax=Sphingomonas xanthus TaxID=2594473 RepID=A0A516ITZ3_9SPHN|nr:endonuclease/exonuclease/phosphatase family protein [Sphingomonas xanthus]QDP20362.1 endonuclease [Sphingomonas xanthus]
MTAWKVWAKRILIAVLLLLAILSFLPLWQTDRWWVRQWDYPRLQVACLLAALMFGLWLLEHRRSRTFWAVTIGSGAALAWQVSHFLAYFPLYPKEVASAANCPTASRVKLLNANVLLTNDRMGPLLQQIERHDPDIVLVLEANDEWVRGLAGLRNRYPYWLAEPVPNTYGMLLLSRLPMNGGIRHLVQPAVPSVRATVTMANGQQFILHGVHPEPPWPGDDSGERDAELVMVGREVRDEGQAAVVLGDLNDVAWSRTSRLFHEVAGTNDPRVGRGFYPTFNAKYPLLRWPLDHLFVSPHFKLVDMAVLPDIGSDHFPVLFSLCLVGDADQRKVSRTAPAGTEAEASQELSKGLQERSEEDRGQ